MSFAPMPKLVLFGRWLFGALTKPEFSIVLLAGGMSARQTSSHKSCSIAVFGFLTMFINDLEDFCHFVCCCYDMGMVAPPRRSGELSSNWRWPPPHIPPQNLAGAHGQAHGQAHRQAQAQTGVFSLGIPIYLVKVDHKHFPLESKNCHSHLGISINSMIVGLCVCRLHVHAQNLRGLVAASGDFSAGIFRRMTLYLGSTLACHNSSPPPTRICRHFADLMAHRKMGSTPFAQARL